MYKHFCLKARWVRDAAWKSQVKVEGYNRIRYKNANWIRLRTVQWQALMNALMNR
jgi:hypothetical protein